MRPPPERVQLLATTRNPLSYGFATAVAAAIFSLPQTSRSRRYLFRDVKIPQLHNSTCVSARKLGLRPPWVKVAAAAITDCDLTQPLFVVADRGATLERNRPLA